MRPASLFAVENLSIAYTTSRGAFQAVRDVSMDVAQGCFVGLVGQSGSGKTTLVRGVLGLLRHGVELTSGRVFFKDRELDRSEVRSLLGKEIGFVPQSPVAAMNPVRRVGSQLVEALRHGEKLSRAQSRKRCLALLDKVRLDDANRVLDAYPHELSGGMAQRVVLAMAVAGAPSLLVADEPTTALDAVLRKDLLDLIRQWTVEGMGVLFISHDLDLVRRYADDLVVMDRGRLGTLDALASFHPETLLVPAAETAGF
jgi:ABC-type glutathione transport system ATPase component